MLGIAQKKSEHFAGRSGRAAVLLIVAIARYDSSSRLAVHPATFVKRSIIFLRYALPAVAVRPRALRMVGKGASHKAFNYS
jgi:hypothetical protein